MKLSGKCRACGKTLRRCRCGISNKTASTTHLSDRLGSCNCGVTVVKIMRVFKDKTLSDKDIRKMIKEIIVDFDQSRKDDNDRMMKSLCEEVDKFRLIKKLLR